MEDILAIIFIFGTPFLIVCLILLFQYLKARMRHKEILAAIEKGVALPELPVSEPVSVPVTPRTPRWIGSISLGVGLLVFSCISIVLWAINYAKHGGMRNEFTIGSVCLALGLVFLIRGLLLQKYEKQAQLPKAG
jgi:hypothetical protein